MKYIYSIFALFFALLPAVNFSQDTLNFLDGRRIATKAIYEDSNDIFLRYEVFQKGKIAEKKVDKADLFSIDYSNNTRKIYYFQDTALGNDLALHEMESYMLGSREAIKNYKAPWVTACGTAAGFAPTYIILNFWGLLAPVVYGTTMGMFTPGIKISENTPAALKKDIYFINGYKNTATRKKVKNALFGSIAGVAAAGITSYIVFAAKK